MNVIQSLGQLAEVESIGWTPALTFGSVRLYDKHAYDYAALYRLQPNVRICVDFLARNIAQLGLHVFRRVGETDRLRLRDHPLATLLERPLPPWAKVTRYRLIETLMADLGIYFNAYWIKLRGQMSFGGEGQVTGLLRVPPSIVTVYGGLVPSYYQVDLGTDVKYLQPDELVHFRGYNAENAVLGLSPLETLRRVLAEEWSAGDYREHFWQNAARMGGIIKRPAEAPEWDKPARDRFKAEFEQLYSGGDNSGRTAILEEGMEWEKMTFSAEESEYLAGRHLTREECARAYHIPLPMVGILEHATFSNIREQHKNLYQDCLGPPCASIEQDIMLQLWPDFQDMEGVYVEFNIAEKLQGSFEEQATTLQAAVGRPWMTPDEARAKVNLPAKGGEAAELGVPLNVMVSGQQRPPRGGAIAADSSGRQQAAPQGSPNPPKQIAIAEEGKARGEVDPTRVEMRKRHQEKWAQTVAGFFQRQGQVFSSRLPKSGAKGVDEVWDDQARWDGELGEDLYQLGMATAGEWAEYAANEAGGKVDPQLMAEYWKESAKWSAVNINRASRAQLAEAMAMAAENVREAMKALFAIWVTSRAMEIARSEVNHAANMGSHEGARASGLKYKTWQVNSDNPREAHAAMDGETVPIGGPFSNGMRWPGDPAGGAENNANCECSVRFGR